NEVLDTLKQLIAAGVLESESATAVRAEVTAGASQTNIKSPLLPVPPPSTTPTTTTIGPSMTPSRGPNGSQGPGRPPISLPADDATKSVLAIGEPRRLTQLEGLVAR